MNQKDFSELIKKKRQALNLSQNQLGNKLHLSNKTISKWENCRGYPDIETIPTLARILNLSYEELLDGNEYIIKKQKERKRKMIVLFVASCILAALIGYNWYISKKGFQSDYTNKDLLVSQEMINQVQLYYQYSNINIEANQIMTMHRFDQACYNLLMKRLDIDHLKLVENDILLQEGIGLFDLWKGTLHFETKDRKILCIHFYQKNNQTYILFNQNPNMQIVTGELYYLDKIIQLDELFSIDLDEFDKRHQINYSDEFLVELSDDEIIQLFNNYDPFIEVDFNKELMIINDHDYKYLIIASKEFDYQTIDTNIDNKNMTINFSGQDALYYQSYLHVFRINQTYQDVKLYVNDQCYPLYELVV